MRKITDTQLCDHGKSVGRVSWPADLKPGPGDPSASIAVCGRELCKAMAVAWVTQQTGHAGVFVPWKD